ncbi:MAG: MaoC family dehydratase [Acidimicrobiia bacterium]
MTAFASTADLAAAVGSHLGHTDWLEITQDRIDAFADATDDHQWIHVDPARAQTGPFGTTIAHGYLTLSLAVRFVDEIFSVAGVRMGVNYGTNKVRFVSPVPVGSKLRAGGTLAAVEEVPGGVQATLDLTFEIEGQEKPACVAQVLYRLYT